MAINIIGNWPAEYQKQQNKQKRCWIRVHVITMWIVIIRCTSFNIGEKGKLSIRITIILHGQCLLSKSTTNKKHSINMKITLKNTKKSCWSYFNVILSSQLIVPMSTMLMQELIVANMW